MGLTTTIDKLFAIVRRDLLTAVRYRAAFALTTAGTLIELAAFYYLSRAIGPGFQPEGTELLPLPARWNRSLYISGCRNSRFCARGAGCATSWDL